jgi:hypothetical protein
MADHVPEKYHTVAALDPKETRLAVALFEHLKKVPVFNDHLPAMMPKKDARAKLDWVSPYGSDDDIYIVISAHAKTYTRSVEDLGNAKDDFIAGWNACKNALAAPKAPAKKRVKST